MTNGVSATGIQDVPFSRLAFVLGVVDALSPFGYFLQLPIEYAHGIILSTKLIIFIFCRSSVVYNKMYNIFFLYMLVLLFITAPVAAGAQITDYIQTGAFLMQLMVTLLFVNRSNLKNYASGILLAVFASTILFIVAVHRGMVPADWGRYSYFGAHPNLGSEIIGMSCVFAAGLLSPIYVIFYDAISMYAVNLMQGRAGLLVIVVSMFAMISYKYKVSLFIKLLVVGSVMMIVMIDYDAISNAVSNVFLLNDEYRGVGTGFVGRDDIWAAAWQYFLKSPIIGNGIGLAEGEYLPHNFFLYGLTQFGILSIFLFYIIFSLLFKMYMSDRAWSCGFVAMPIFMIFNARFINLNLYPYLLYVAIFAYANVGNSRQSAAYFQSGPAWGPARMGRGREMDGLRTSR